MCFFFPAPTAPAHSLNALLLCYAAAAVPLWKRLNAAGLTPLTLAASMGQREMFSFLLDERKITQWTYGPVSCVLYPLDQLDLGLRGEVNPTPRPSLPSNPVLHLTHPHSHLFVGRHSRRCAGADRELSAR